MPTKPAMCWATLGAMLAALALPGCPLGTPDVDGFPITCNSDSDCVDAGFGEVCDTVYHLCIAPPDAGFDAGPPDAGPTGCVINDVAYDGGAFNPASPCQTCQPGIATNTFSPYSGFSPTCPSGEVCNAGTCTLGCYFPGSTPAFVLGNAINAGNPCQVCLPTTSTSNWQLVTGYPSDAGSCPNANLCLNGRCTSGCFIEGSVVDAGTFEPGAGCESCNPSSETSWTGATGLPPAGACPAHQVCNDGGCAAGCIIGTTFVPDGGIDPSGCNACNSEISTTSTSALPSQTPCYDGGTYCNGGTCENDCLIDGGLVTAGTLAASNSCQSCQPAGTPQDYSSVSDGTLCDAGGNYCQSGSCMLGCEVPDAGFTLAGRSAPEDDCQVCGAMVGLPATSFGPSSDGLFCGINGGTFCEQGVCAPVCIIGTGTFDAGALNPANPDQCCNPDLDAGMWTAGFAGQLTASTGSASAFAAKAVAIGNVTNRGHNDIVAVDYGKEDVAILGGNGNGTFATPQLLPVGSEPQALALASLTSGPFTDIAVVNTLDETVTILINQGDGGFNQPGAPLGTSGPSPQSIAIADVNGDGIPDLVVPDWGNYVPGSGEINVWIGNGDGTFSADKPYATGLDPVAVVLANFENQAGTAVNDVATAGGDSLSTYAITVLHNNLGTFATTLVTISLASAPVSLATADFNADGFADISVATSNGQVLIFLNQKASPWFSSTPSATLTAGTQPSSLVAWDANGDLAVTNEGDNDVGVFINQTVALSSTAAFAAQTTYGVGLQPTGIAAGELTDGGLRDLAVANSSQDTASILLGQCP